MKNGTRQSTIRTQNFREARLLVIERNDDQWAVIEQCLKMCLPEVNLIRVANEGQAVTYLNTCKTDEWKLPRMILLDMFMPYQEDGWRTLQRIKELPSPVNHIPVIMFSSSTKAADISEAYDRGSSSYLVKPTSNEEWLAHFQMIRKYWWETVSLPSYY